MATERPTTQAAARRRTSRVRKTAAVNARSKSAPDPVRSGIASASGNVATEYIKSGVFSDDARTYNDYVSRGYTAREEKYRFVFTISQQGYDEIVAKNKAKGLHQARENAVPTLPGGMPDPAFVESTLTYEAPIQASDLGANLGMTGVERAMGMLEGKMDPEAMAPVATA